MFLKMDYEILESTRVSSDAKLILSHLQSLKRSGKQFWGYFDWFTRWGISAQGAQAIIAAAERAGIVWKDSAGSYHIVEDEILFAWLSREGQ